MNRPSQEVSISVFHPLWRHFPTQIPSHKSQNVLKGNCYLSCCLYTCLGNRTHSLHPSFSRCMLHSRTTHSHFVKIVRVGCIFLSPYSHFVEPLCKTYHCVTVAATFHSKYNYLHYLQRVQLFKLSTVGTAIYTVYSRYNYLHCLQ